MTETVPKPMPIANCPVCKLRGLDSTCTESFGFVSCNWCVYQCGTASEDDGEEAIRLHNLISRPQQSAEPVAQLEVRNGIAGLKHLLAPIDQVSDGMMLYRASPGPSELVEEMDALLEKWGWATHNSGNSAYQFCADELRAMITRHRGKS